MTLVRNPPGEPASSRRLSPWMLAVLALALLFAVDPGRRLPAPVADEATSWAMVGSLVEDGDLVYGEADIQRAVERWRLGPRGLRLEPDAGEGRLVFAAAPVYAALVAPLRWLFGPLAVLAFQALCLALLVAGARRHLGAPWGLLFFLPSAALPLAFLPQPTLLLMLLVFYGLVPWQRDEGSWLGGGVAWGLAVTQQPMLAILPLFLIADLVRRRRWRSLLAAAVGVALAALLVTVVVVIVPGAQGPWPGEEARVFERQFPETGEVEEIRFGEALRADGVRGIEHSPRRVAAESWYLLAGRHGGWLVFYPLATLLLLALPWSWRRGRQAWLAFAVVLLVAVSLWQRLEAVDLRWLAGAAASWMPALVFLAPRPLSRRLLAPLMVAIALWTLPTLLTMLYPATPASPATRWLPLELTALDKPQSLGLVEHRGRGVRWFVPQRALLPPGDVAAFSDDPSWLWLRGGSRLELWAVSRAELSDLRLEARALDDRATLTVSSAGEVHRVRFDTPGKRSGTWLEVPLRPRTADLGVFSRRERFYRIELEITGGRVVSGGRFLGVQMTLEALPTAQR